MICQLFRLHDSLNPCPLSTLYVINYLRNLFKFITMNLMPILIINMFPYKFIDYNIIKGKIEI